MNKEKTLNYLTKLLSKAQKEQNKLKEKVKQSKVEVKTIQRLIDLVKKQMNN